MKILAVLFFVTQSLLGLAIEKSDSIPPGRLHSFSISAIQPLGEFSETHHTGVSARYVRSLAKVMKIKKTSPGGINPIYGAFAGWHKGKRVFVNGVYEFHYDDLLYAALFGGAEYRFPERGVINISLGPAMSRYRATNRFNIYSGMDGNLFITDHFGICAGMNFLKEMKSAWIAMARLGVTYRF